MSLALASSPQLDRLLLAAKRIGCSDDQIERFLVSGYVPLPWQLEFHAAARLADHNGGPDQIGVGGSRGPGKSHAILAQVALDDCQRIAGLKVLYLRKIAKQAVEQFDDLRRKVLVNIQHKWTAKGTIVFPNTSRIVTGHFKDEKEIDNYLGIEYDVIVIEETTTLTASKYQALRDSNRTSKFGWRPRIYNSTNPAGIGHTWYKNRFVDPARKGEEKWTRFIPATLDDNIYIDEDYKRRVEENTGWRLRAYRYGDWDIAVGQFFSTWRHDIHVVPPLGTIPDDWPIWAGFDYGFTHNSVFTFLTRSNDGEVYAIGEHARNRMLPPAQAAMVKALLNRLKVPMPRVWPWAAGTDVFQRRGDTSGKTIAEQYGDVGIHLTPADTDRINGWAEIHRRLGDPSNPDFLTPPSLYICSNCVRLIDSIPAMIHDPNKTEDVLKVDMEDDGTGGDDSMDSLRYAIMARGVGASPSGVMEEPEAMERYDQMEWGSGAFEREEPTPPDLAWNRPVPGGFYRV